MFDSLLLDLVREIPRQTADVVPLIGALATAHPAVTALIVTALVVGGGNNARKRRVSSRAR
jgi:multisubunit Na+/H+ antiporter MnhC subunit